MFFFDALFGDELLKKVALAHKRHFFSFYQAPYEVLFDKLSAKMNALLMKNLSGIVQ